MKETIKKYTVEERLRYVREYLESGMSKSEFVKSHGLGGSYALYNWLRRYGSGEKAVNLYPELSKAELMARKSNEEYRDENKELRKKIKSLEKQLEFSHLETHARDMLIDKAESYFDIQIRKKSGAK